MSTTFWKTGSLRPGVIGEGGRGARGRETSPIFFSRFFSLPFPSPSTPVTQAGNRVARKISVMDLRRTTIAGEGFQLHFMARYELQVGNGKIVRGSYISHRLRGSWEYPAKAKLYILPHSEEPFCLPRAAFIMFRKKTFQRCNNSRDFGRIDKKSYRRKLLKLQYTTCGNCANTYYSVNHGTQGFISVDICSLKGLHRLRNSDLVAHALQENLKILRNTE